MRILTTDPALPYAKPPLSVRSFADAVVLKMAARNADDDYRLADDLVRAHAPLAIAAHS